MERRKFTRFRTRDDAYAALRGNFTKVGKIYDISLNGLAFRYLAEKACSETYSYVDIFLSSNGFHLSDVPCTIVCDEKECIYDSLMITSYRLGLKFDGLDEEQENNLEFFINNHTTGVLDS
jgi:c-di-GMP-binding flagellar brake protein YcgR